MNKLSFIVLAIILAFPNVAYGYTQKYTSGGRLVSWKRSQVDITVVRTDNCSCPSRTEVISSLERSAATWNEIPAAPHINITENSDSPEWGIDGINGVYLVQDWPFSFRALAVTLTTYNDDTGELIDTDIIINGEMRFGLSGERNRYDLDTVLTHELGHVLGLDESDVRGATMFPDTRRGETDRRQLSTDDVDGILSLYRHQTMPVIGCSVSTRKSSFNKNIIFLLFILFCKRILKFSKYLSV